MEFLQRSGLQGSGNGGGTDDPAGKNGSNDSRNGAQSGAMGDAQAQTGQQSNAEQSRNANSATSTAPSPATPTEPESEIPDGTSQNALEYLTGGSDQQQSSDSTQDNEDQPGTLSIEELLNAQGVLDATGGVSPPEPKDDPDKDSPQTKSGGS